MTSDIRGEKRERLQQQREQRDREQQEFLQQQRQRLLSPSGERPASRSALQVIPQKSPTTRKRAPLKSPTNTIVPHDALLQQAQLMGSFAQVVGLFCGITWRAERLQVIPQKSPTACCSGSAIKCLPPSSLLPPPSSPLLLQRPSSRQGEEEPKPRDMRADDRSVPIDRPTSRQAEPLRRPDSATQVHLTLHPMP